MDITGLGNPNCTCDNDPPEVIETIYTTCDQGGSGVTTDDVGTLLYVASDDQNASYFQTYSYAVTDPYNAVMLRRKSLKLSSPDGIGLSNYTWLGNQSEEFQGFIYDYLEGTVNFDGLFSDADYYPLESVEYVQNIIEENRAISETDYPGKEDGLDYQWWNDDVKIEQILGDPYEDWKHISEQEKILTKNFPKIAYRIYQNRNIAISAAISIFGDVPQQLNGMPDAFRHAFFQAINCVKERKYMTQLFADAHESEVPERWELEKEMDLFNNEEGMDLIEFNHPSETNHTTIANYILSMLNSGQLVYLSPIDYFDPQFYDNLATPEPKDGNHGISTQTQVVPTNQ